jgi:hypothetical protein
MNTYECEIGFVYSHNLNNSLGRCILNKHLLTTDGEHHRIHVLHIYPELLREPRVRETTFR